MSVHHESKHVHVLLTSLPQPPPSSPVPLSYPRPPLVRRDFFDPDQDGTYCKIGVRQLVAHSDVPVPVTRVFLENPSQECELHLYRRPLFLPPSRMLCRGSPVFVVSMTGGEFDAEMVLHARGQTLVTERYHNRQEGLYEDIGDVVYKEDLKCAGAFWDDRTRRVCVFEVLCDRVCVGEYDWVGLRERARWIKVGAARNMSRVEDRGKDVDRSAIGASRGRWRVDGAHGWLDFWELDPAGAVWKTFVVEDQPEK